MLDGGAGDPAHHELPRPRAQQVLQPRDARLASDDHPVGLRGGHGEVPELREVELHAGAEELLQDDGAAEVADERPVTRGGVSEVIGGDDAAHAGHVVGDDVGRSRDVPADVAADHARVGVESPAAKPTMIRTVLPR